MKLAELQMKRDNKRKTTRQVRKNTAHTVGRNNLCPCGSKMKFKFCCEKDVK